MNTLAAATRPDRCERHGEFISTELCHTVWSHCPACNEESAAQDEREERENALRQRLQAAGIPSKFADARLDDSLPQKLRCWVQAVAAGDSEGPLIVVGNVGTGKSHAACGALHWLAWQGWWGRYITAGDYGRAIRSTWGQRSECSEAQLLRQYAGAELLVLDELGAHRDIDAPLLQDLIAMRYEQGLMAATIVISNHAFAGFSGLIGERAADRIREGATVLAMTGASRRQPARRVME